MTSAAAPAAVIIEYDGFKITQERSLFDELGKYSEDPSQPFTEKDIENITLGEKNFVILSHVPPGVKIDEKRIVRVIQYVDYDRTEVVMTYYIIKKDSLV